MADEGARAEMVGTLTDFERKLLEPQEVMEIRGKVENNTLFHYNV